MATRGGGLDIGSVVKWGALIGGGYWLYTKVAGGSSSGTFSLSDLWSSITGSGPSVGNDVLDAAVFQQFVTQARAGGQTDAQIQATLNQMKAAKAACVAPGVWSTGKGACVSTQAPAPPVLPPAPTLAQSLAAAAQGDPALVNGMMNADKWNYYRNNLFPPALTSDQFVKAFPYVVTGDRNTQLTIDQFVSAIKGAGLGALGLGALPARAHRVVLRGGRQALVWVPTGAIPWRPPAGVGARRA